ncbi:MAG: CoA-binding protein [Promethearchaeota archaeon]
MKRVPDFTPFFQPKSVLIVGASRNEYTSNGVVLKNLLEARYKTKISIFHPYTDSILGIPTIKTIEELAALQPIPELAIVLTRHNLLEIIEALGKNNIKYVLLQADINYVSSDQEYEEMVGKIQAIIKQYDLNVLGPSMIGIIDYMSGFTSSVIPTRAHFLHLQQKANYTSGISFLSQSGGLSGACGWWNLPQPVPFSKAFHIGGEIQYTYADMLEFLLNDPNTQVITLYLKSISPEMIEVMLCCGTCKPVLVKYVGKDPIPLEKFKQAGAIPVRNYIELFEFAKVFMWCPAPIDCRNAKL